MKLLLSTLTRNKKGQVARVDQTLTAEVVRIGRGTDCTLFLPDPRITLHHALLRAATDRSAFIESDSGSISVDGRFERASKLHPGQRILIGPYELMVLDSVAGHDLALSIELIDPLREGVEEVRSKVKAGLGHTWLSKRVASWAAFAVILAAFLAWPALNAFQSVPAANDGAAGVGAAASVAGSAGNAAVRTSGTGKTSVMALTADASWDPGPLSSAHASFGRACATCHQTPFVQVKNEACEDCHKTIGWHFPLKTPQAKAVHEKIFPGARCASCHRDHKGPNGLVRTDATLCTDCHRDLKSRHPDSGVADISEFTRDHPAFKLSILQPGKTGADAIIRVAQDGKPKPVENSGLKFPHDKHLDKKGVRGPDGKVQLECASCHTADDAGIRFKPVTMKDHCQNCHSLEFEPKVTTRQAPHGNTGNVIATLNEFYAQAALADTPIDVVVEAGTRRLGERLAEGKRQAALAWASDKAGKIARDLFEDRVCFACHQITRVSGNPGAAADAGSENQPPSWKIAPVAVTQHWLPKSRFPHNQHNTYECAKCHAVSGSKTSADIAIPDIKNCRECHGGNEPAKDKARGTCETCHGFHTGSHKAGVPVIVPGSRPLKPISSSTAPTPDVPRAAGVANAPVEPATPNTPATTQTGGSKQ